MRVLVTGGAGFIGSAIADLLADTGHRPLLLDSLTATHRGRVPGYSERHELVHGELTDRALLRELLPEVDAVTHQAATVGHGLDAGDLPDYAYNNDYGTAVLLAELHRAEVRRLVLASSMVVYGEGGYRCAEHGSMPPTPRRSEDLTAGRYEPRCPDCARKLEAVPVTESAPLEPKSAYAATKLAQEHLAAAWARQTGGQVWALRYHNVYGPRMPLDTPYSGVAALFRSALLRGEPPSVLEDGAQRRDFVHVRDVARANLLALERPLAAGESAAVNVCSGAPRTVGELATALAEALGGPRPRVLGGARAVDVRHVFADPSKARSELGFSAATGFAEGIAEFAREPTPTG